MVRDRAKEDEGKGNVVPIFCYVGLEAGGNPVQG